MHDYSSTPRPYTQHGHTGSPEYYIWLTMFQRCCNPKNPNYPRYGGRGITVCDAWTDSFVTFLQDMGARPTAKHRLQRLDKNQGYYKENCLWDLSHGMRHTPEYTSWAQMLQRCYNPQNLAYPDYGGRGITVCDRWRHSFAAFLEDMGARPTLDHSLERIQNNDGYSQANCQWETMHGQTRNKRNNIMLTRGGITQCLADWVNECGIPRTTFRRWILEGCTLEDAIARAATREPS